MKKLLLKAFTIAIVIAIVVNPLMAQKTEKLKYVTDHIIVQFKDGVLNRDLLNDTQRKQFSSNVLISMISLHDSLQKEGVVSLSKVVRKSTPDRSTTISRTGENISEPDFYNLLYVKVPDGTNILKLCKKMQKWQGVIYAEPDFYLYDDALNPNDQYFVSQQKGLEQTNDIDIDVKRAWDFSTGNSAVRIGIIDGGVDYHHPDLGNGAYRTPGAKIIDGYDYDANNNNGDDKSDWRNSHGTAVAGIIGALSNNTIGVAGIAGGDGSGNTGVSLVSLRVELSNIFGNFARPSGQCIEAIYDASLSISNGGYGCHIINFSGGGYAADWEIDPLGPINGYRKALSYAANNGVIFVASKGNDGSTAEHYPSDYADNLVISVGASNGVDNRASFSNYSNGIDLVAPGTVDLIHTTKRLEDVNGPYDDFDGTSAAAPVVSGVVGLLKSVNINLHRDDVENIIEISAEPVNPQTYSYANGYNVEMGHGRINAGRALELIHAPYVLQHHTATGGTSENITHNGSEQFMFNNDAGNVGLAEGAYIGKIYQVTKTVTIPKSACNERYVWPRTTGATIGWSAATENSNLGYSHIISQNGDQVTLRTYVYYIETNSIAQQINAWFPAAPQNVVFAYTTLTNTPYTTDITGSSWICTSGNTLALSTIPPNSTFTWQASPANLFAISSGTGSSANLSAANSTVSGQGTITFTISNACGTPVQVSKTVWVGKPYLSSVTYDGMLTPATCSGLYQSFAPGDHVLTATASGATGNPAFILNSFGSPYVHGDANGSNFNFNVNSKHYNEFEFTISASFSNACGSVSSCTYFTNWATLTGLFPNPSTNEVNLQLGGDNELKNISIYNSSQVKVFESSTTEKELIIGTASFHEGNYVVKIIKGGKISSHHLQIKH